jgi:hypothetical protein
MLTSTNSFQRLFFALNGNCQHASVAVFLDNVSTFNAIFLPENQLTASKVPFVVNGLLSTLMMPRTTVKGQLSATKNPKTAVNK